MEIKYVALGAGISTASSLNFGGSVPVMSCNFPTISMIVCSVFMFHDLFQFTIVTILPAGVLSWY
jgi:hypothetical protein